jgi:hypothetical protein
MSKVSFFFFSSFMLKQILILASRFRQRNRHLVELCSVCRRIHLQKHSRRLGRKQQLEGKQETVASFYYQKNSKN